MPKPVKPSAPAPVVPAAVIVPPPPAPVAAPGNNAMLEEALARIAKLEAFLRECLKTATFNSTQANELLK